jgi:hypothetical protein
MLALAVAAKLLMSCVKAAVARTDCHSLIVISVCF